MANIPNKPDVRPQGWVNGITKLNQNNLTAGINRNVTNLKVAIDGLIDALGGEGHEAPISLDGFMNFFGTVESPEDLPPLEDCLVGDAYFVGETDPYDVYVVTWEERGIKQWSNIGTVAQGCDSVDMDFSLDSTNPVANQKVTATVGEGEALTDANRASIVLKGLPFKYEGRRYTFVSSDGATTKYSSTDTSPVASGRNVVRTYLLYFAITDPIDPCRIVGNEYHEAGDDLSLLSASDVDAMWGS